MTSTTRLLNILFLGAIAVAVGACANPAVEECGATGVFCPSGTHCAAAQGICLPDTNTCGNAHLDPGEVCDDGNTIDGDGCAHDCSSTEVCGNGIRDVLFKDKSKNEVCDDGNTQDGDGCSHDCLSLEKCGNGIKDVNEECDDGNTDAGDGCSPKCTIERCGNGIVDAHEVCDDGNTNDGDACSHDCLFGAGCGNGIIDVDAFGKPLEECDDGNTDDNDDCRNDCVVNRCGDGIQNLHGSHVEACDGATPASKGSRVVTPTDTAACNSDCTVPSCGDGKLNRTFAPASGHGLEQCEPPSVANGCSADCRFERCGNGVTDPSEECDDGTNLKGSGCFECRREECGNGRIDPGEQCDDGNPDSGDGCTGGTLAAGGCRIEFCGDGVKNDLTSHTTEDCDTTTSSATCNFDCTTPTCGDHIVNSQFTPPGAAGPEQCDPPSVATGCSATCRFEHCGNGVVDPGEQCDNGTNLKGSGCFECRREECGNGRIDPGEQCDDGNPDSGDGCTGGTLAVGGCRIEFCGDGTKNDLTSHTKEDCDTTTSSATCNFNCTTPTCGDHIVNTDFIAPGATQPEQCDPPSVANGCSASCRFEHCGNSVVDPGEQCDNGTNLKGSGCFECRREECGNGRIDPGEQCDDGNPDSGDGCTGGTLAAGGCRIEFCGDGTKNDLTSHTKEDCDTTTSSATCNFNCTTPACGDHIVNTDFIAPGATQPEQCDPPSVANGCSASCRFEHCGNGVVDPGEQCDNGTNAKGSGCFECRREECGNGRIDPGEQCDDGNPDSGDGCTGGTLAAGGCRIEFCGDGTKNDLTSHTKEDCDTTTSSATCNFNCTTPACGDHIVNTDFIAPGATQPEQCDPPSVANGCSASCRFEHCGNGVVDPGEQCDNGTNAKGSGCFECRREECGNGRIDPGEQCDDGNPDSGDGCTGGTLAAGGCHIEFCGDGIKNNLTSHTKEDCDTTTSSPTCNFNCTTPTCGDHIVNPDFIAPGATQGEQCDPPDVGKGCSAACRFEQCGNGVVDPGEECDDSANNGAAGDSCSATCLRIACGNLRIDSGEVCDDGNQLTCGSCSANCGAVTPPAAATGMIIAAAANVLVEGDNFIVDDGAGTVVTFTFTNNSSPPHLIRFPAGETSGAIAVRIATAINSVPGLQIVANTFDTSGTIPIVTLRNRELSSNGNKDIVNNVNDVNNVKIPTFGVFGMTGGRSGDCGTNDGCASDADCTSNNCVAHKCQLCTLNSDCESNLCFNPGPTTGQCRQCVVSADCGGTRVCTGGVCTGP